MNLPKKSLNLRSETVREELMEIKVRSLVKKESILHFLVFGINQNKVAKAATPSFAGNSLL